jgi:hypothetical protein
MSLSIAEISQTVLELSMNDRAVLIDKLFDSIDSELDRSAGPDIQRQWAVESEDRIDAVDRGELKTLDGPSALAELHRGIRK